MLCGFVVQELSGKVWVETDSVGLAQGGHLNSLEMGEVSFAQNRVAVVLFEFPENTVGV